MGNHFTVVSELSNTVTPCNLVFCLIKLLEEWVCVNKVLTCRWPAMGIHGDKSQQERDWVLNGECFSSFCKHV